MVAALLANTTAHERAGNSTLKPKDTYIASQKAVVFDVIVFKWIEMETGKIQNRIGQLFEECLKNAQK